MSYCYQHKYGILYPPTNSEIFRCPHCDVQSIQSENATLKAQVKRLREALEFYADQENWIYHPPMGPTIDRDKGYRAKKTIQEMEALADTQEKENSRG